MTTSNQTGIEDVITLSNISDYDSMLATNIYGSDTISVSDLDLTVPNGGYTVGPAWPGNLTVSSISAATLNSGAITGLGAIHPNTVWSSSLSNDTSGTLELNGDNADIKVNGTSLMATIKEIQERLNILVPNPELEADWDDLRALGEQYRALEKKCKEKVEAWNKLKSMPPPEIL